MSSTFARTAAEVKKALISQSTTNFSQVASQVRDKLAKFRFSADRDAEWQRVNSYIADTLKDTHVLYAKLARLQGDFAGAELDQLQKISEAVLVLGDELSVFSKDFYEGKYQMQQSEFVYGDKGGSPIPNPEAAPEAAPAAAAPPTPTSAPEGDESPSPENDEAPDMGDGETPDEGDYDVPVEVEEPKKKKSEPEEDSE